MKSLYMECKMGAAGDMLSAALYELCNAKEEFLSTMNALLPGVSVRAVPEEKCGICGTRMVVTVNGEEEASSDCAQKPETVSTHSHPHEHGHEHEHEHNQPHTHAHNSHADIREIIETLQIPDAVKNNALAVYASLALAEATVHGKDVSLIHFHEVGALDAVADIVGFCLLVDMLGIDEIRCSPIHVGSGMVHTMHGILPVPAPATAQLLLGIPTYSDGTPGELCTPTGAALLRHFASDFLPMPCMAAQRIGYGMGKKNFPAANCVRAFLLEQGTQYGPNGNAVELRCNVDDMTPEAVGFAMQALLKDGAKDVYVQQVLMKKSRPGFVIVCLCAEKDADRLAQSLFLHTTTIGVRRFPCERYELARNNETIPTSLGDVRMKRTHGYGVKREKPEYDDIVRLAEEHGISFLEAERTIREQFGNF